MKLQLLSMLLLAIGRVLLYGIASYRARLVGETALRLTALERERERERETGCDLPYHAMLARMAAGTESFAQITACLPVCLLANFRH